MYGWKARIGWLSPSPVEGPAIDFYKMAPPGVTMVSTALSVSKISKSNLNKAGEALEQAVLALAEDGVDYIIVVGEPMFWMRGPQGDHEIMNRLRTLTSIPMIANVTAAVEAVKKLGIRRLAVPVAYQVTGAEGEDCLPLFTEYLTANGINVVHMKSLKLRSNLEIAKTPGYLAYQFSKEVFQEAKDADGLYIPCARFQAVTYINDLEKDLSVPVVTSVQACLWKALEDLNIRQPVPGFGRLLEFR